MRRPLKAAVLSSALAAVAVAATGSPALGGEAVPVPQITAKGVGGVKIGSTLAELQRMSLVGGARKGCELAPGQRVAPLEQLGVRGFAVFYPKNRVSAVAVTGGAARTAAGVGIGTGAGKARKAYPGAVYDPPPPRAPIQVGFIWIGGRSHPRMTLVIDPDTHRVSEIAVPVPNICE